jgi:DNA integrity scanning protein DisA with diadenylate cyclase activity
MRMKIGIEIVCKKVKFDKIGAMLVIANSQKLTQRNFKRKEVDYYFCKKCNAFHVTSKKWRKRSK